MLLIRARRRRSRGVEGRRSPGRLDGCAPGAEKSGGQNGWSDLAALVAAHAQLDLGDANAAIAVRDRLTSRRTRPPELVHDKAQSTWRSVRPFGPLESELLEQLTAAFADGS